MSYSLVSTDEFERQLKRLGKRYGSLREDVRALLVSLLENPVQGDALGASCYKVRMAIAAKNKGKSGGARVITCVKIVGEPVYLLTIYDKSDRESLEPGELPILLAQAGLIDKG